MNIAVSNSKLPSCQLVLNVRAQHAHWTILVQPGILCQAAALDVATYWSACAMLVIGIWQHSLSNNLKGLLRSSFVSESVSCALQCLDRKQAAEKMRAATACMRGVCMCLCMYGRGRGGGGCGIPSWVRQCRPSQSPTQKQPCRSRCQCATASDRPQG